MSNACLPEALRGKRHDDWPWLFRWVPRSWTSFCGDPPRKLFGNQERVTSFMPAPNNHVGGWVVYLGCKPIPPPGQWQISWPPYIALTTKNKWHFRWGARWNDAPGEAYYTFPSFKIGRLPK